MFFPSQAQDSRRNFWLAQAANRIGTPARLGLLALAPLLIWLVFNWFQTIRAMVRDYNPLPVWDYWRVVQYFDRYRAFDFSVLWVQHNEHRIVFPEMVFAADMLFFHGCKLLPLVTSFVCYFLVWIVLCAALRSDKTMPPLVYGAGVLLSGIIVGWQGCVVVLGDAFLLQWTMLQLAVMLGFFLLANTKQYQSRLYLAGTIVCGIVATYSSGNGMLLWPILIFGALLLRIRKLPLLALIVAAILSISLYFIGYHSSNSLNVLALVKHPAYLAGFIFSYLSMPFGAIGTPRLALIIGGVNFFVFLIVLFVVTRRRLFTDKAAIVFVGSYLFTLASALLTAAGRMNPADSAFIAAKAARYVSLPLVNWAVLVLALIWLSSKRKWEIFSLGNLIFIVSMIFLVLFPRLHPWLQGNDTSVADQQWTTLSLESGLVSPSVILKVFPDPGFVESHLLTLQQNHLSIYWHQPEVHWVGHSAQSEFPGAWNTKSTGKITRIFPVIGGSEVTGIESPLRRRTELVLVNDEGRIVGLGEKLPAGIPTILQSANGVVQQGWVGFLNARYNSKQFSAYVVNGKNLTQITSAAVIPQVKEVGPVAVGASVPGLHWQATHWSVGSLPSGIDVGHNYAGAFWGSWNSSDASTGQVVSSDFTAPANGCIVLPVLHGPSVTGLSAEIVDSQNNRNLAEIPLQDGDTQWKLWRIPIEPGAKSIKISGHDEGAGWGQWLALGTPLQCR